jgi:hypothetical protein
VSERLRQLQNKESTCFAPLAQKIQSICGRRSPHLPANSVRGISFTVRRCRRVSIGVPQSRKASKNLCKRRALPTELCPREETKIITVGGIVIKHSRQAKRKLSAGDDFQMCRATVPVSSPNGGRRQPSPEATASQGRACPTISNFRPRVRRGRRLPPRQRQFRCSIPRAMPCKDPAEASWQCLTRIGLSARDQQRSILRQPPDHPASRCSQ